MTIAMIEDHVRDYLVGSFLSQTEAKTLANDDDLLLILNSLELLRMVIDLESSFSIKIDDRDLTAENLGTVSRIAAFVADKRAASSGL